MTPGEKPAERSPQWAKARFFVRRLSSAMGEIEAVEGLLDEENLATAQADLRKLWQLIDEVFP